MLAAGARVVTLRGPPGVGKTALARGFVAARLRSRAGGSVVFVSLAGAATRGDVLTAIARALGLAPRTADLAIVAERVARRLDGAAVTLVLDGVDAMLADVRAVIDDLLSEVFDAAVVVCARSRLGSSHEEVLPLGPLSPADAAELLLARVDQAAPGRDVPPEVAAHLAGWAGALPLAVEIAAGWVATLGARETLAALGEGRLAQDALDRALDASWELLSPEERDAFARLAVFARRFDLAAARAVLDGPRAEAHLAALVSASLLDVHESPEGTRYAMLDGVRAYATKRAAALDVATAARARLARHLADAPRPRADRPASWRRLAEERDDLVGAWQYAVPCDSALALDLAIVLDPSLSAHGPSELHLHVLRATLAAAEADGLHARSATDGGLVVDLFYALGRFAAIRGRHAEAAATLERGVAIAAAMQDDVREAWLRAHLVLSLGAVGRDEEASAHLTRADALARRAGDARLEATVESARADVCVRAGALDLAAEAYSRAAAAARDADALRLEGTAWLRRGRVQLERGDVLSAEHALAEARRALSLVADAFHLARASVFEALASLRRGEVELAEERLLRALEDVRLQDDLDGELHARFALVSIARGRGDHPLAARRLDDVTHALRRAEDVAWRHPLAALGGAHAVDDERARAVLSLARDGRSFELGGRVVDFGRRGPLRRLLVALAEHRDAAPGRSLSVTELREAGWPGEKMRPESGASRVYMAVKRLRALGLEAVLRTSDEGYALDLRVEVRWKATATGA
jgi:predicted ATPase